MSKLKKLVVLVLCLLVLSACSKNTKAENSQVSNNTEQKTEKKDGENKVDVKTNDATIKVEKK